MIPLLPKWNLMPNRPSFYDTDSKTVLELSAVLTAKMNELIESYNEFVDATNKTITEFVNSSTERQENFEVGIRQEFQDFIDIINLKFDNLETNMDAIVRDQINKAIASGTIHVEESYDPNTESLNMTVTGGV